jgi:hypothetical protein
MEEKFSYQQTLPVLSRPWPSDAAHPDYVPDDHHDDTRPIQPYQQPQAQVPPIPAPAPASTPAPAPTPTPKPNRNAPAKVRKPRKANTNASGKSTLFWVNSDPQTAAEGTKEETLKRIRSHVMSEHNRKKRMESTKQYNKDKWKPTPYQTPAGALVPTGTPRASISSSASLSGSHISDEQELEQVEMSNALVTTSAGYPVVPAASWDGESYGEVTTYPSIWSCVGQGANDPFNTGHTQLTDRMMRHLRVCKSSVRLD